MLPSYLSSFVFSIYELDIYILSDNFIDKVDLNRFIIGVELDP